MSAVEKDEASPAQASIAATIAAASERERAGQAFGAVGAALKPLLDRKRRALVANYARGDVAAVRLAGLIDETLAALLRAAAARHAGPAAGISLAAVGGYGRGALAPYSDIDILFLHEADDKALKPLLDLILYPLWDSGLKIGHAVHTPRSAAEFARADLIARTSFLDARLVAGAPAPYADFQKRFEKLRRSTKKQFVAAKLAELDARHETSERSHYLAEPDLKEGKGGLRDLQTIGWLYKYEFDLEIDSPAAKKRLFSVEDMKAMKRCERLLWSIRLHLHALRDRADDRLSFDVQPALAESLGYAARPGMTPAERLMKDYFVNALEVGRLTRIFRAKLEEEQSRLSTRALKVLPGSLARDEAGDKANLKLAYGRLHFDNAARARRTPLDQFRLFRAYGRRPDYDLHPDALAIVAAAGAAITPEARRDPEIAKIFMATLADSRDAVAALRAMAETGLLGRYIPAFGKIIGRIEYGLYRRYSVDEGVFRAIGVLAEIERGREAAQHPISSGILAAAEDRGAFYLAVLLHETAWSLRDGTVDGAERLIVRIARRLGFDADAAADIAWCAARHLLMVRTMERRNLSDAQAIATFAEAVGDQRRLELLLLLTVCHLRVIGLHSWDDWSRRQLTELYEGSRAFLAGGREVLDKRLAARAAEARREAAKSLSAWPAAEREAFLNRLSDEMFRSIDAGMIARIGELARSAEQEKAGEAVAIALEDGDVEAIVYARDRAGLLADLAGAVASAGASVRSVQVFTTADGRALDVFSIQSVDGAPIEDAGLVKKIHARLLEAAAAKPVRRPSPARRIGDRRAMFAVAIAARVDLDASADAVVIEAEGRDRPGLLYDLASALADLGAVIVSAHVGTYGARAVDAFYLQDALGRKITDRALLAAIEQRLIEVLSAGEPGRSPLTVRP